MGNKSAKKNAAKTQEPAMPHAKENGDVNNPQDGEIRFDRYAFPFENVVFQGGGSLCLAYCGAVKVLEEARVWKQIKRLAGTGVGGLMAALFAADYTAKEVEKCFANDILGTFEEAEVGCCPSSELKRYFGLDSGRKLYEYVGSKLKRVSGDPDISFAQLQKATGKELCIVTMNLSQMAVEYCHPKTTPDMPIRIAISMTMAQPGQFQCIPVRTGKATDYYIAGGPVCNFPIHCFDGWYLSTKPEDQFARRPHPLEELNHMLDRSEAFARFNNKTLGFFLYSECQRNPAQVIFEQRDGVQRPPPNKRRSRLAKKRIAHIQRMTDASDQYNLVMTAALKLLKVVTGHLMKMGTESMSKNELEAALDQDSNFSEKHVIALVGPMSTGQWWQLVDILPAQSDGQITYADVNKFVERKRYEYRERYFSLQRHKILNLRDFAYCLRETMQMNNERLQLQKCDVERTVGINGYYLQPGDQWLQKTDRDMLKKQGDTAVRRFLSSYIRRKSPPLKDDIRESYCCDDVKYFIDDSISEIIDLNDYMEPVYT